MMDYSSTATGPRTSGGGAGYKPYTQVLSVSCKTSMLTVQCT